jgi:hypothetical protein
MLKQTLVQMYKMPQFIIHPFLFLRILLLPQNTLAGFDLTTRGTTRPRRHGQVNTRSKDVFNFKAPKPVKYF